MSEDGDVFREKLAALRDRQAERAEELRHSAALRSKAEPEPIDEPAPKPSANTAPGDAFREALEEAQAKKDAAPNPAGGLLSLSLDEVIAKQQQHNGAVSAPVENISLENALRIAEAAIMHKLDELPQARLAESSYIVEEQKKHSRDWKNRICMNSLRPIRTACAEPEMQNILGITRQCVVDKDGKVANVNDELVRAGWGAIVRHLGEEEKTLTSVDTAKAVIARISAPEGEASLWGRIAARFSPIGRQ